MQLRQRLGPVSGASLRRLRLIMLIGAACGLLGACSGGSSQDRSSETATTLSQTAVSASSDQSSASSLPAQGLNPAHQPEDLSRCQAPANLGLDTIGDVVDWINAMPKPLTLACFIASLPRPIFYNATTSPLSAQPSLGRENPRVFIRSGAGLWLSFVTQEQSHRTEDPLTGEAQQQWDLDGEQTLELSQGVEAPTPFQSIKAELAFPILAPLAAKAPFSRIVSADGHQTLCAGCHNGETAIDAVEGVPVFRSNMLRNPLIAEVAESDLRTYRRDCNPTETADAWYRCQLLEALLGRGPMIWLSFDEAIPRFL
jgi:hypothetical protein